MKYLNLSQEEITLVKIITRKKLLPYMFSFTVVLAIISLSYSQVIKNNSFINFMPVSSFLGLSAVLILILFLVHFIYTGDLIQTILKKKKVIYSGILSSKKIKESSGSRRYVFYMDGMKFSVNEMDFQSYNAGEMIEFHVSLSGKHLIKISRPSSIPENS